MSLIMDNGQGEGWLAKMMGPEEKTFLKER